VVVVFALVYLHVLSAQKQFEINSLTTRYQQAATAYQGERLAAEEANSPASIVGRAERLGMHEPRSVTYRPARGGGIAVASPAPGTVANGAPTPAGIADWPAMKTDLAGAP
jgi:hypothetical protein